jgi:hypothetical protein
MTWLVGFLIWYIVGIFASLFWPWWYRDVLHAHEWKQIVKWLWLEAFFGPLMFVLGIPL